MTFRFNRCNTNTSFLETRQHIVTADLLSYVSLAQE